MAPKSRRDNRSGMHVEPGVRTVGKHLGPLSGSRINRAHSPARQTTDVVGSDPGHRTGRRGAVERALRIARRLWQVSQTVGEDEFTVITPTAMMMCSRCRGRMSRCERNGITIDQCTECRGTFLSTAGSWNGSSAPKPHAANAAGRPKPTRRILWKAGTTMTTRRGRGKHHRRRGGSLAARSADRAVRGDTAARRRTASWHTPQGM